MTLITEFWILYLYNVFVKKDILNSLKIVNNVQSAILIEEYVFNNVLKIQSLTFKVLPV